MNQRFRGCHFNGLFLETPSGSSGGRKPRIMWWRPKCWCSSEFAALADGLVAFFSVFPECMQLFMHVFVACAGMSAASYESIDGMRA